MSTPTQTPVATLAMVTLDCADPQASATFWSGLLGWAVAHAEPDYAMLTGPSHALGFGRVENYEPPTWPNEHGSKQFHFDLAVADLDSRGGGRRAGCHAARGPARRDLAGAARPGWAPVLPDEGGELRLNENIARGHTLGRPGRHPGLLVPGSGSLIGTARTWSTASNLRHSTCRSAFRLGCIRTADGGTVSLSIMAVRDRVWKAVARQLGHPGARSAG